MTDPTPVSRVIEHQIDKALGITRRKRTNGRKRNYIKRLPRMMVESVNDDANLFLNKEAGTVPESGDVVLGVYGTEDWILSTVLRERYLNGGNTVQHDDTWLVEASFDLVTFAEANFDKYMFFGANSVSGYTLEGGIVKVSYSRGKIEVEITGDLEDNQKWVKFFNENFKKAEALIEWIYNARGDDISVPLNYRAGIRAAYPWIDSSYGALTEYIDEYIDAEASVLILIGPPGTGKTTFIKNLIHRSKSNAKVTYDPKIMMDDSFFAGFIDDDTRFLIMEDADEFLKSREDGNTMMHKFLNVSDGLISAADKKLVFSTNLPNVSDIDEALMRPGRCFDVLQFRALSREEAQAVLDEVQSDRALPDGATITLAEVFSTLPSGRSYARRKIGFV